jgi:hypothetical protein
VGLDIYLQWRQQTKEERATAALNELPNGKVTYLRSDYSDSGFVKWCHQQLDGRDFHWIFQLNDDKCIEMTFDDGSVERGFVPDWEECRQRTLEALELARRIPDSLYTRSLATLLGDVNDLVPEEDIIQEYRRTVAERREALAELHHESNVPIAQLARGFKQGFGYFFEDALPKIKAIVLSRLHTWPSVVVVCEGAPEIHKPYIEILEETLRFIDCGRENTAWLTWSE